MDNRVRSCREGDIVVLTIAVSQLHGEQLCREIGKELIEAVEGLERPRVVVDLSEVEYVASMGLAILLRLHHKLAQRAGRLVLCGVTAWPADVLDVTKVAPRDPSVRSVLELAPDVTSALAQLGGPL
jgi:anti-anti-sigma factor